MAKLSWLGWLGVPANSGIHSRNVFWRPTTSNATRQRRRFGYVFALSSEKINASY